MTNARSILPCITPAFQYLHLRTNPICAGSGAVCARKAGLVVRDLTDSV